jgi:NitT/TauT family transport system substrate-binding protein
VLAVFAARLDNGPIGGTDPLVAKSARDADGFADAIEFIKRNPEQAADMYMKAQPFIGTREILIDLIKRRTDDDFAYTATPQATKAFMDFMAQSGSISKKIESSRELWFDNVWQVPGN